MLQSDNNESDIGRKQYRAHQTVYFVTLILAAQSSFATEWHEVREDWNTTESIETVLTERALRPGKETLQTLEIEKRRIDNMTALMEFNRKLLGRVNKLLDKGLSTIKNEILYAKKNPRVKIDRNFLRSTTRIAYMITRKQLLFVTNNLKEERELALAHYESIWEMGTVINGTPIWEMVGPDGIATVEHLDAIERAIGQTFNLVTD